MATNVEPTIDECRWARYYNAKYPPRCNHGNPCHECRRKWAEAQQAKLQASQPQEVDSES